MHVKRWFKAIAVTAAGFGLLLPLLAAGAEERAPESVAAAQRLGSVAIGDVAFDVDGTVEGMVVDTGGAPLKDIRVVVSQHGWRVSWTGTDSDGRFLFSGLRSGIYTVKTPGSQRTFRLWAPDAAPPVASKKMLIVDNDKLARSPLDSD